MCVMRRCCTCARLHVVCRVLCCTRCLCPRCLMPGMLDGCWHMLHARRARRIAVAHSSALPPGPDCEDGDWPVHSRRPARRWLMVLLGGTLGAIGYSWGTAGGGARADGLGRTPRGCRRCHLRYNVHLPVVQHARCTHPPASHIHVTTARSIPCARSHARPRDRPCEAKGRSRRSVYIAWSCRASPVLGPAGLPQSVLAVPTWSSRSIGPVRPLALRDAGYYGVL
jgi:hypothetical protein